MNLTARHVDVLRLLCEGLSDKQIADRLGVREPTVRNHMNHIRQRLRVHNRVAVAVAAIREGVVA